MGNHACCSISTQVVNMDQSQSRWTQRSASFAFLRLAAHSVTKLAGKFLIVFILSIFAAPAFGQASGSGIVTTFASQAMESDNLSDDLRARGLRTGNNAKRVGDINISVGGPILKDRIRFFS